VTAARLHVAGLTVARFRSHARASLDLDGRPVALWGPNGAGKTNLLEAVSLLSPGRGLRRARGEELARAGSPAWRIRAKVVRDGAARAVVLTGEADGRRRVEIDGKAETQTALGALAPMLWLTPAMDRLWIEGAEGRRRFLDRAALSFEPGHAEAALGYDKAMRERNRLLKDGPRDPRWLDALEARMAEAGLAIARARATAAGRLTAAQTGAKSLFPMAEIAIVGELEQRVAADAAGGALGEAEAAVIMDEFRLTLARGRHQDAAAGRALNGPHRSDLSATFAEKGIEARLCSTGEQKALLISLTLGNARALSDGGPPILLLDEVAAHLDAGRRAALYDEVCALRAQAWMTGTGPELFAELGARAQQFVVADSPDGSTVAPA
jgi:DNA replication and repair protein RecF